MKRKIPILIALLIATILLFSMVAHAAGTKLFFKGETQISNYEKVPLEDLAGDLAGDLTE